MSSDRSLDLVDADARRSLPAQYSVAQIRSISQTAVDSHFYHFPTNEKRQVLLDLSFLDPEMNALLVMLSATYIDLAVARIVRSNSGSNQTYSTVSKEMSMMLRTAYPLTSHLDLMCVYVCARVCVCMV